MDLDVELRLLLVEVSLVAISEPLLPVSEGLFEYGDALIGVEGFFALGLACFSPPVGSSEQLIGRPGTREQIPLGVVDT